MRINVYSQELTSEVLKVTKQSNTGITYHAVQFVLHSSPRLHHPPSDDDRSAVTFWLPQSERGLREFKNALSTALNLVNAEYRRLEKKRGARKARAKLVTQTGHCACGFTGGDVAHLCSMPQRGVES